ncbi:hypothetical protein NPN16_24080, partial [Vibrio parahaemolyticus]|nr:hypothetical protein [Vibrio parahaemolyticus]
MPSPGIKPTIVSEHIALPDASRASVVGGLDTTPPFNVRLDSQPDRAQSAAPYPVDDRPAPLNPSQGLGPQADR